MEKIWRRLGLSWWGGGKVEFHIPSAIASLEGYTSQDLARFNVDDELIIDFGDKKCKLKLGEYLVKDADGEFVIYVDCTIL